MILILQYFLDYRKEKMLPQKNKRPRSDDDVQFQRSRTSVNNQMQINDSPMEAEGVSPIPQDLPISAVLD